jgi:sensor histidine kinase YesM
MDYIQKYIELQRLRFDHPINVHIRMEGMITQWPATNPNIGPSSQPAQTAAQSMGTAADTVIPPLLLIPFVENAFKHGDFTGSEHGLAITLSNSSGKTRFHCSNRKGIREKDAGGGIGLENVKRRLSLLYPGRHSLSIEEDPLRFSVNLELIHE